MSDTIKVGYGKYIWLGGGATIVGLFAALSFLGLFIHVAPFTACEELTCDIYFNVTNPTYLSKYLFNHEDFPISFSAQVEDYQLYAKYYGKWRYTNFTRETRFPNIPEERKYVFVFPAYSTKEFKLVVKLEDYQVVKYTLHTLDASLIPIKEIFSETNKPVAVQIGAERYDGFWNKQENTYAIWHVPVGDRNLKEFPLCIAYEEQKGVCTQINLEALT